MDLKKVEEDDEPRLQAFDGPQGFIFGRCFAPPHEFSRCLGNLPERNCIPKICGNG